MDNFCTLESIEIKFTEKNRLVQKPDNKNERIKAMKKDLLKKMEKMDNNFNYHLSKEYYDLKDEFVKIVDNAMYHKNLKYHFCCNNKGFMISRSKFLINDL